MRRGGGWPVGRASLYCAPARGKMSDDPKTEKHLEEPKPDPTVITDAMFTKLEANRVCPICRNPQWWIIDSPDRASNIMVAAFQAIPAFTLACTKCGYVQQFIRDVLTGKLPPPSSPQQDASSPSNNGGNDASD